MGEITIQLLPAISECSNYQPHPESEKEQTTIVISTTKIHNTGDRIKNDTGCSMFEGCFNPACYYSVAARKKASNGKRT